MQWMQKGHDYCPYCRKEMMTAQDMRTAALGVLGPRRVDEVSSSASAFWWTERTTTNNTSHNDASNRQEHTVVTAEIQMSELGNRSTSATGRQGATGPAIDISMQGNNREFDA